MQKLTLLAPAKLNLTLDITGVAPNGYHTLDMVMQTVSLYDTVTLEPCEEIRLVCPAWLPGGQKNLAYRAAEALRAHAGVEAGALITLEKNIPAEAGMGGGSADAGAVLRGLNDLWGLGLGVDELCKIALVLGSDVPFAVAGGTARVRGIGDLIDPIQPYQPLQQNGAKPPKPPVWFTMAKPEGGVNTAEAYRMYDEAGAGKRPQTERFIEALQKGDIEGMARLGGNALEKVAVAMLPEVGALLERVRRAGAGYSAMTGSGAAVFGVFETEGEARRAQEKLGDVYWSAVACSGT